MAKISQNFDIFFYFALIGMGWFITIACSSWNDNPIHSFFYLFFHSFIQSYIYLFSHNTENDLYHNWFIYKKLLLTLKNHDLHVDILQYNVQWSFNSFLFFCFVFLFIFCFVCFFQDWKWMWICKGIMIGLAHSISTWTRRETQLPQMHVGGQGLY